MDLKVINEITTEIKNFKSIEEFNLYYQKHKDDMNNQTTQYLNRVYKIVTPDGVEYRITKKNCQKEGTKRVGGDIFLKKVVKTNELKELEQDVIKAEQQLLNNRCSELRLKVSGLEESVAHDIENLKSMFSQNLSTFDNEIKDLKQSYELKFTALDKKIAELTNTVNQIAKYINQQIF